MDSQFPATEFGLAKEFQDQSRKGVFLYLHMHIFLCVNEFLRPKKEKKSLNRVQIFFFKWVQMVL
jgi:hypothetical protein